MSESIRRRSSSRQLLQNLIRVTAQRSQEDAEEVERERRRRARERQREEGSPPGSDSAQHHDPARGTEFNEDMKPSSFLVVEEDEGFSDWSHRLENRHEQEAQNHCRAREQSAAAPKWKPEAEEEKRQQEDEERREPGPRRQQAHSQKPPEKVSSIRKEARTSYSSSVFLPQDGRPQHASGQPADRTSYLAAGTMKPGGGACRLDGETQQHAEEGDRDNEELSFTQEEKEEVDLTRARLREEEERKMAEKRLEESRGRRDEDGDRSAAPPGGGEEPLNCYGPMSPTFKKLLIQFYPDEVNGRVSADGKCTITERTECLRKSTSNVKKTASPPVAVSRINKKLEEYAHALEVSSKEGRSSCQLLADLTSGPEPVASKKNLFEAREVRSHNPAPVAPSKADADGLKVGVADLINQWVRGSEDGSRCSSPCKPAESSAGKKYTFVVTGHGKYEKVSVENSCSDDVSCQAAGLFCENL